MNRPARFAINFLIYLVFGGGIFAFVGMRGAPADRPSFTQVLVAAVCLAFWSGALTTLIEIVVATEPRQMKRTLVAGGLGALSLGGFATILSWLAWHGLPVSFLALGVLAGGLMHAARGFSAGEKLSDDDEDDADDSDDADDAPVAQPASPPTAK